MSSVPEPDDEGSRLWKWLKDVPPCEKSLAWCHTTDGFAFRDIVASGVCELNRCEVFGESLIYFFYGRPAFRVADTRLSNSGSCPVVLLFDESLITSGRRLYPFDSGAFRKNLYSRLMHSRMQLFDFELVVRAESPRRVVAAFYGNNENYLQTKAFKHVDGMAGEYEVEALLMLLQDCGLSASENGVAVDDRRITVELQLPHCVELSPPVLKAVIYPDELMQARWMKPFMEKYRDSVMFQDYRTHRQKLSSEYQGLLEDRSYAIQSRMGII